MTIDCVVKTKNNGLVTEVSGLVNNREIISISNSVLGEWSVTSSACLPSDIAAASEYVECMRQVLSLAKEHGFEGALSIDCT